MNKLPKINKILPLFQYGLVLFVLLIPFADFSRMSIFVNKILPVRILLGCLFLAGFGYLISRLINKKISLKQTLVSLYKDPIFVSLTALWVVRGISLLQTHNFRNSLELYLFYTAMIGLYVFLRAVLIQSRFYIFTLIRLYVYTALVIGAYGLFQFLFFKISGRALPGVLVGGDYIRLPATFYDANHFAAYLAQVAPLVITFAWLSKKNWQKILWWLAYFGITFVVLYSFSRSGLLALGVGSLIILGIGLGKGYYHKVLPLLGALFLAGIVVFISNATGRSLVDRAKSIVDLNEPSTQAHFLLLKGEVELFSKNPLFGIGYGSFSEKFRAIKTGQQHSLVDRATDVHIPAHSVWFEVMTETGLTGLAFYLAFVYLILKSLIGLIRGQNNKALKIYAAGFLSGAVGIWIGGIFYSYNLEFFWFFLFLSYLFTKVVGILLEEKVITPEKDRKERLNWAEIIPAVLIIGLGAVFIFQNLGRTFLISSEAALAATAKDLYRLPNWFMPLYQGMPYFTHPPFYLWVVTDFIHLYGPKSIVVRFFPALFGLGVLTFTYLIGRKNIGVKGGFLGVSFLLFFTPFLYLSRSVNPEIIALFLILTAVYLLNYYQHFVFVVLAGICFGLAGFTDTMTLLLLLPAILTYIYYNFKNNWTQPSFRWALITLTGLMTLPWPFYAAYYNFGIFSKSFIHFPNPAVLLPILSLLIAYFTIKIVNHIRNEINIPETRGQRYLFGLIIIVCLTIYLALPRVAQLTTPPNSNKDLVALLLGEEYKERVKYTLYLDGVSSSVASFYTDGKIKVIEREAIESIIPDQDTVLLITSISRGNILISKFNYENQRLRKIDQKGDLMLLATF